MLSNTTETTSPTNPSPEPSIASALLIGATTHVGQRRTRNEDSFCIADASLAAPESTANGATRTDTPGWPKGALLVLTDGVGGVGGGEIASQTSARVAYQAYYAHKTEADDALVLSNNMALQAATDASLRHCIQFAHESLRNLSQQQQLPTTPSKASMASTIVMAVVHTHQITVTNVGDSRCYLLRAGQLQQLSTDHSWVAEQVRAGLITPEAAAKHEYRNVISQSLGASDASPTPSLAHHDWQAGDRLLLCSDGLWGQLSAAQITSILSEGDDPQPIADKLIAAANAAGGSDNITAIVAFHHAPRAARVLLSPSLGSLRSLGSLLHLPKLKGWFALPLLLLALGIGLGALALRNSSRDAVRAPSTPQSIAIKATVAVLLTPTDEPTATPEPQPTATLVPAPGKGQAASNNQVATSAPSKAPSNTDNAAANTIVFCRLVLRSGRCADPETRFFAIRRPATVYGVWAINEIRDAKQIVIEWFRNDVQVDSQTCTLNGARCAERNVSPTQASTSSRLRGQYRLQVLVDERPVLTGSFTVK